MGSIYRQKASKFWWIKYYRDGRPYRESSGSEREADARRLLRLREGDIERGAPITPRGRKITVEEAAADLLNEYRVNGKRSLPELERRLRLHLLPFFKGRRLASITTADVRQYIAARQAEPFVARPARLVCTAIGWREEPAILRTPSNAEINRELTHLKRMFSLAIEAEKLLHRPRIPMLKESAPRAGFFERSSSRPCSGRNAMRPASCSARASSPRGCSRGRAGSRIQGFSKAWRTACRAAGCPGRIPHDFRRTAVRNLERAGISRSVAMAMVGHKTEAIYRRYDIVSERDLTRAAEQLDVAAGIVPSIVRTGAAKGGAANARFS